MGVIYSILPLCSGKYADPVSFALLGLYSASVFNGNMAFIAVGFPQQFCGRLIGVAEIFSTIAGLLLIPLGQNVISEENWQFYHILLLVSLGAIGLTHMGSIYMSIKNACFIKLDRYRKSALIT